jgi:hypothetical protein
LAEVTAPAGLLMDGALADACYIFNLRVRDERGAAKFLSTLRPNLSPHGKYSAIVAVLPKTRKDPSQLQIELAGLGPWRNLLQISIADHPFFAQAKLLNCLLEGLRKSPESWTGRLGSIRGSNGDSPPAPISAAHFGLHGIDKEFLSRRPAPIEEAETLKSILAETDDHGNAKYSVVEVAAKIGRHVNYIYEHLKLLELPADARQGLSEGRIGIRVASMIARIANEAQRGKAAKEIVNLDGQPMTKPEAERHLRLHYMPSAEAAPPMHEAEGRHQFTADLFCRDISALEEATGYSPRFLQAVRRWSKNRPDNPFRGVGAHASDVRNWVHNHPEFEPSRRPPPAAQPPRPI